MVKKRAKLLAYLRNGASTTAAVRASGIGRSTYNRAMADGRKTGKKWAPHRDFRDKVTEAIAASQVILETRMFGFTKSSWGATMAMLRARFPERWNPEVVARMAALKDEDDFDDRPLPTIAVRRERKPDAAASA